MPQDKRLLHTAEDLGFWSFYPRADRGCETEKVNALRLAGEVVGPNPTRSTSF